MWTPLLCVELRILGGLDPHSSQTVGIYMVKSQLLLGKTVKNHVFWPPSQAIPMAQLRSCFPEDSLNVFVPPAAEWQDVQFLDIGGRAARAVFTDFKGASFAGARRMVVFNHHDMLLMIFHQWRAMVSYQKFIYGNGYWMMIQGWSKLLAILRFPAISSKTAGANEILNPAVQVGTLLGMTSVTVRWLWVKVLDEYIGWFLLCYICLIIIQCIICIFTNIYIYSDIEQNLQNRQTCANLSVSSSANSFGHSSFQFHSPLSATAHPT